MMNQNVKVLIKGLHKSEDDSADLGTESIGKYYLKNEKHYILYEEKIPETEVAIKNTIKVSKDTVEVIKKGYNDMHLIFSEGETNHTYLATIAGKIFVGVNTEKLIIKEENDSLDVDIEYSLIMNEEKVSDCKVQIKISSNNN